MDSSIGDSVQMEPQPANFMGEEADFLRGSYIRRLTAVVIQHIPAFWRLALSVFSGKFAKVWIYTYLYLDLLLFHWSMKTSLKLNQIICIWSVSNSFWHWFIFIIVVWPSRKIFYFINMIMPVFSWLLEQFICSRSKWQTVCFQKAFDRPKVCWVWVCNICMV